MGIWIKVAAVMVVAVLAASVFLAWRDALKEQATLQADLKSTQQALAQATARQASRDAAVNDLVASLKKKEAAVQKPAQVVAALPDALTLPAPITIEPERPDSFPSSEKPQGGSDKTTDRVSGTIQPKVNFPAADLKPLYDFALDCKACQAKLSVAEADLADEKLKNQALGRERDDALRAAKGGSVLRRIVRAAKWFAIGAAAGAIAAKAAR
jgi:hypothetical protein